ncbi:MAG: 2-dehydropantoate 2-reductase [Bacteroidetes bacterium]|nr:MAG: 2-dehydropantoate 2-reductase [Bacteroidota bacterium]
MPSKFKIAILGIGAVGGYYGGKLAAKYSASDELEAVLIARGENAQAIESNGLKLITPEDEQIIHPTLVSNEPERIGPIDLLLCCVKSYDRDSSLLRLAPCITDSTIILPVINGIDNSEKIRQLYPHSEVWEGCVYIVSRLIAPGVVHVTGKNILIHFGSENGSKQQLERVHALFKSATINANLASDIKQRMWEKFLFVSPFATVTSYLDLSISEILSNPQHVKLFVTLLEELLAITNANGISFPADFTQNILERMKALPPGTTSSMHTDFQKGKQTELQSLTGHVVQLGKECNIPTPYYTMMLHSLKEKSKG